MSAYVQIDPKSGGSFGDRSCSECEAVRRDERRSTRSNCPRGVGEGVSTLAQNPAHFSVDFFVVSCGVSDDLRPPHCPHLQSWLTVIW